MKTVAQQRLFPLALDESKLGSNQRGVLAWIDRWGGVTDLVLLERSCPGCGRELAVLGQCSCGALICSGCSGGVDETEEGRCAHCRMLDRGDDRLVSHDSRGWLDRVELPRRWENDKPRFEEIRVPCQCGCGMVAVPLVEEPAYQEATPVPRMTAIANPWGAAEIIAAMQAWYARYGKQPTTDVWNKATDEHPNTGRVMRVFGSWNAAIAAAGFEPKSGRQAGGWKPKAILGAGQ